MGDVDEKLGRLISKMDEYCADMRRRFVETFSDELESSWREDESDELARLREENERLQREAEHYGQENARLWLALTPSNETKQAYWGEFCFQSELTDVDGNSVLETVQVPWTTVKDVMKAIRARAALKRSDT